MFRGIFILELPAEYFLELESSVLSFNLTLWSITCSFCCV